MATFGAACKVCKSRHKSLIEHLSDKGYSPEKIFNSLQNLMDERDRIIVAEEDIRPSSIRRHLQRHYDKKEQKDVKTSTNINRNEENNKRFIDGIKINIDKANTLSYLIQKALNNIEEIENESSNNKKHQYTISYMGQIKSLIDELDKVSGAIKEEGTIDSNFYRNQVDILAKIVLATIRELDQKFKLNFKLEIAFSDEFKKQYALFREREQMILNGETSMKEYNKQLTVNTFNDDRSLV